MKNLASHRWVYMALTLAAGTERERQRQRICFYLKQREETIETQITMNLQKERKVDRVDAIYPRGRVLLVCCACAERNNEIHRHLV